MIFNKGLIIEIIGPSGAGKTSLGEALVTSFQADNVSSIFVKKLEKNFYKNNLDLKIVINLIKSFIYIFYVVIRLNFRKNKFNFFSWKKTLYSSIKVAMNTHSVVNSRKNIISVIEPGYLMLLLNGCMYRKNVMPLKLLNKFLNNMRYLDVLIYISLDSETALKRISTRERGEPERMNSYNELEKRRVIELSNLNSKNIVNFFQNKEALVLEVDGKKTINDNVKEIINLIKLHAKL
jgi:adenylate kinase family enzyme